MKPHDLDRLREVPAPGEAAARRRARSLAHAHRPEIRRGRHSRRAAAPAGIVALLLLVLTPPGEAFGDWLRDRVREVVGAPGRPVPRVAADTLPGGGRILLTGPHGPVVVGGGRRARLLGRVDDGTWSPRGRFVAAGRGPELIAVDRRGRRRWSIVARSPVRRPRWSPDGFRVAYLSGAPGQGGRSVRVVAGDGTGDRVVGAARPVAPAWRPETGAHQLAYVDAAGRVVLRDTDSGRVLWRLRHRERVEQVEFTPGGERLLVLGATTLGHVPVATGRPEILEGFTDGLGGHRHVGVAPAPGRHRRRFAVVVRGPRTSRVELVSGPGGRRTLLTLAAPLGVPAWSPDGRWIAVPRGSTTVLLRVATRDVRTVSGGRFEGWCCAPVSQLRPVRPRTSD